MSMVADVLADDVDRFLAFWGIPDNDFALYFEAQELICENAGNVCPSCGGAAPLGVGDTLPVGQGYVDSAIIDACACGASRLDPDEWEQRRVDMAVYTEGMNE